MQPWQGSFGSLFYALGLNVACVNDTFVLDEPSEMHAPPTPLTEDEATPTYYVDYNAGSDSSNGSVSAPFKTLLHGECVWLCGRVLVWLCGCVAVWLCGRVMV